MDGTTGQVPAIDASRFKDVQAIDASKFKDVKQFNGFDREKKRTFLELYAKNPDYTGCARAVGVDRSTVWYAMKQDPAFKLAFEQVREGLCDQLEDRVYEYGQRPQNFMDRIAYLRAYRPDRWNPNKELPVKLDVTVTHQLAATASQYIDTTATDGTPQPGQAGAPLDRADKQEGTATSTP